MQSVFDVGTHAVFNGLITYTEELVHKRCEHTATVLRELDADIVVVNEVGSNSVLHRLARDYLKGYSHFMAKS